MKLLLYPAFFLFCVAVQAQVPFTFTPNPLAVSGLPSESDVPADAVVQNTTSGALTLKWERINISMPSGMHTMVCDPNSCWAPGVSSKQFTLNGNQSGSMILHFVNEDSMPHDAIVHIKLTNVNNTSQFITGVFTYSTVTGTHDVTTPANVRLLPNPVTNLFAFQNDENVSNIQVFSMQGNLVASFKATPGEHYSMEGQPAGMYIIGLQNKDGRTFQAIEMVKQ